MKGSRQIRDSYSIYSTTKLDNYGVEHREIVRDIHQRTSEVQQGREDSKDGTVFEEIFASPFKGRLFEFFTYYKDLRSSSIDI